MKSGVNVVVVCTCIGGIFHFEIFDEYEIFDDLNLFNFSILGEESADVLFSSIIEPADIEFSD